MERWLAFTRKPAKYKVLKSLLRQEAKPLTVFSVQGKGALTFFQSENGGHRWVRIPPTEKKGRVHTSTVTVAVFESSKKKQVVIDPLDVVRKYTRSRGKGGQNVNKVETCVVLTHLPTGITVRSENGRKRDKNEQEAWRRLTEKLQSIEDVSHQEGERGKRSAHNKSNRSEKVRTYKVTEKKVTDHRTHKTVKMKDVERGRIEKLK